MTIALYARRNRWPLTEVVVRLRHSRVHAEDCADCETKQGMLSVIERWRARGYELGFGVGVAAGYATLGVIGFSGRFHYGAIGSTVNLASRLCDEARDGQVLVNARIRTAVGELVPCEPLPDLTLKGFSRPVRAFNVPATT